MTSSGGNCSIKTHPGRLSLNFKQLREDRKRFALYLTLNSQIKYNFGGECVPQALCFCIELYSQQQLLGIEQRPEEERKDKQ